MTRQNLPLRSAAFGLLAITSAVFVGMITAVTVNETRNPAVAVAIGVGPQGQALSRLAFGQVERAGAKRPNAPVEQVVSRRDVAMARAAYSDEPLAVGALAMIAMGAENAGQEEKARQIYRASTRLSRRSPLIMAWLVRDYAQRNEENNVFQSLSRLIRTAPETQAIYIPMLAQGLERKSSVEAMAPLLGTGPAWKVGFWREVAGRPNSLRYGALLRARITEDPWRQRQISETDRELLAAMVVSGYFEDAASLARRLRGRAAASKSLIVNGDFSGNRVVLTPFDWQFFSGGDFGADLDEKASALDVSALPEVDGLIARQLIDAAPGRYRLSWRAVDGVAPTSGGLRASLQCAEPGKQIVLPPVSLAKSRGAQDLSVPDSCRWYWLNLEIEPSDPGEGLDLALDTISLQRVVQTAK